MSLSQTLKIFSQWGDSYSRKSSTDVTLMTLLLTFNKYLVMDDTPFSSNRGLLSIMEPFKTIFAGLFLVSSPLGPCQTSMMGLSRKSFIMDLK